MVGPSDNGSEESDTGRRNAEESYICQQAAKICGRRSEGVKVGLEGPCELFCTAAAIWYVLVIDVLRSVASTQLRTSNVLNSLSVVDSLISLQTDLHIDQSRSDIHFRSYRDNFPLTE